MQQPSALCTLFYKDHSYSWFITMNEGYIQTLRKCAHNDNLMKHCHRNNKVRNHRLKLSDSESSSCRYTYSWKEVSVRCILLVTGPLAVCDPSWKETVNSCHFIIILHTISKQAILIRRNDWQRVVWLIKPLRRPLPMLLLLFDWLIIFARKAASDILGQLSLASFRGR